MCLSVALGTEDTNGEEKRYSPFLDRASMLVTVLINDGRVSNLDSSPRERETLERLI